MSRETPRKPAKPRSTISIGPVATTNTPPYNMGGRVYVKNTDEVEGATDVVTGAFFAHSYPINVFFDSGLAILLVNLVLLIR